MNSNTINWWNGRSDEYYANLRPQLEKLKKDPSWAFPQAVWRMIREYFPDLRGKRVLVPSSGDNFAVFGFYLLGARVTSCDISERQLFNAKQIAHENFWNIRFIQTDSMELKGIEAGEYDLVYTSNGVHVWITDLARMYGNFYRVLKPNGVYIMFETHPFIRPFDGSSDGIKVIKSYNDIIVSDEIIQRHWRIADIFNGMQGAGFYVKQIEEFFSHPKDYDNWFGREPNETDEEYTKKYDRKHNPWAALPQWLGFSARK